MSLATHFVISLCSVLLVHQTAAEPANVQARVLINSVPNHGLPQQTYPRRAVLNQAGATVEWRKVSKDSMEFQVTTPKIGGNFGYFGFGLSPNGGMRGADIVIGWIDENGQPQLQDRHAVGFSQPLVDTQQDWSLVGWRSTATSVVFRMQRRLSTCDENDLEITSETTRLIYASSPIVPVTTSTGVNIKKHALGSASTVSVFLFDEARRQVPTASRPGERISSLNITMKEGKMFGDADTTYWCEIQPLPKVDGEVNVIGFAPIFEPGHERFVHHMLLFICNDNIKEAISYRCDKSEGPSSRMQRTMQCTKLIALIAKGTETIFFPQDVSLPLTDDFRKGRFLLVQMHYSNPKLESGVVDHSGVQFFITNKPRLHQAGVVILGEGGVNWTMAIPPKSDAWKVTTECSNACLSKKLPETGINIFQAALHTHLLGTKVSVRQIRNGAEIATIAKDDNYDPDFQNVQELSHPVRITKEDSIIVDCTYNSMKRQNATFGGVATTDEMCMAFLMYYPAIDLTNCVSTNLRPAMAQLYNMPWTGESKKEEEDIMNFINTKVDWSEETRQRIQAAVLQGPQLGMCFGTHINPATDVTVLEKGVTKYIPLNRTDKCHGR